MNSAATTSTATARWAVTPPSARATCASWGRSHTAAERLHHLDRSCGKVAEYWRRIGAAGVAPFTIASSYADGNHWFLGPLRDGRPKNVWNALTVLWSPQAVSMDIWDCNFIPGQEVTLPLHFFNDTDRRSTLTARVETPTPFRGGASPRP